MIAIQLYDKQGSSAQTLQIATEIVRKEESPRTFACAIRVHAQNWRQGTVACKSRGELAFSNKKPWRQKGTGRARVSSIRSPLWRKGGIIFGPQPRVRQLAVNAQQKRLVFNNLFFSMLDNKAINCIDFEVTGTAPTTKAARQALSGAGFENKKIVLFLSYNDVLAFASFRNLPNVMILLFDEPNAYHLSNCEAWVFLRKDADSFKEMVAQWN